MSRVFPGVADVLASLLFLVSMLIRLDFPTLDRPIKAYSGMVVAGHLLTKELLIINSALLISIIKSNFWANIRFFRLVLVIFAQNQ